MIARVCVPIICKGMVETCEEDSLTCSDSRCCCCGGRTPSTTACTWLANWAAPPVVRKKSAAAATKSILDRKREGRLQGGEGEKSFDSMRL